MIISVSFAAVVITGTVYGAGLKAQQEYKAVRHPTPHPPRLNCIL
jgi:hypothetical protein